MEIAAELDVPFIQNLCERFGTLFGAGITVMAEGGVIVAASDKTRVGKTHPIGARVMAGEIDEFVVTRWVSWRSKKTPLSPPTMIPGCNTALDFRGKRIANMAVAAPVAKAKRITQIVRFCLLALIEAHVVERERALQSAEELQNTLDGITADFRDTVQSVVPMVLTTVHDMAAETEETLAALARETASTQSVFDASRQAAGNVETVAGTASQLSGSISDVNQRMAHLREITEKAQALAGSSSQSIAQLASATEQIGAAAGLIQEISAQTNLLALNATIEAARAGDAGKGFAVVASEVNALAHRASQAAEQIAKMLDGVQKQSRAAVKEIEGIARVVDDSTQIATSVAAAMEEQSQATAAIAGNAAEAASAAAMIEQRVNELQEANQSVEASLNSAKTALQSLQNLSDRLQTAIDRFLGDINQRHAAMGGTGGPASGVNAAGGR